MERQEYLEQQIAAIASNDDNLIKDPNLKAELFTIPAYQTIIVQCKLVAEKREPWKWKIFFLPCPNRVLMDCTSN